MKRSSRKKQLAKWSKLGLSLAAVTVLGGLVEPVDVPLLSNSTVEAQELTNQSGGEQALPTEAVTIEWNATFWEELVGASYKYQPVRYLMEQPLEIHLQPGETYTLPTYDGHKLVKFKENFNEVTDIAPEDAILSYADFTPGQRVRLGYDYLMTNQVYDVVTKQYVDRETAIPSTTPSINSPTSTPTAQPAETQVVTAKVTAFKLEELVGANYKYQPMGTFSLEPVVIQLQPGETYTPPSYDGYKLVKFEYRNSVTDITSEEATISYADFTPGQEISLDYYYLNTKQVYDVLNKRYVDRDTNLSPLPPIETPTIDNTTDTANSSVDVSFQEASTRLYNLLMTASRLNPEDYTAESYNKGYESLISPGFTESIVTVLNHYKEVVNGNVKLEDRWDNGASPKVWLTEVYNSDSSVLEQALAGLVAVQQETPSDSSSAGTDEGTTGKTSQTPKYKPVESPVDPSVSKPAETPAKSPAETPTNQPSTDQAEQSSTEPTVLSKQDSQAGTASPTDQSAQGKQATKQGDKEQAPSASSSQKEEVKPAPTSQPQAKTLPATGEASSILHLTGLGLLGLAGLVVKRRQRKSF
ncbi:LPXTG cell wall anchor domain-containing protein [Streptococcus suis]|nr:LPXTG cell wall anchor domain-containing protein [Streptococcus suis]